MAAKAMRKKVPRSRTTGDWALAPGRRPAGVASVLDLAIIGNIPQPWLSGPQRTGAALGSLPWHQPCKGAVELKNSACAMAACTVAV